MDGLFNYFTRLLYLFIRLACRPTFFYFTNSEGWHVPFLISIHVRYNIIEKIVITFELCKVQSLKGRETGITVVKRNHTICIFQW